MTPLIQWASRVSAAGGKYNLTEWQWFDATQAMQNYFSASIAIDAMKEVSSPMPFHQMFICLLIKGNKLIMRIEQTPEGHCTVATLAQTPSGQAKQMGEFMIFKENGTCTITKLEERLTTDEDIQNALTILAVFQNSLNYQSVQVYQPYVKNTYTNQRLIKKGKPPLFEWKTVTIEPQVRQSVSLGGTHASPRLHDRRGHWRTMKKSGKRVWVRDCKVGDPSKGIIKHDYKFRPTQTI